MTPPDAGQLWFLGILLGWLFLWAIGEAWLAQRRRKRDKYADYNE